MDYSTHTENMITPVQSGEVLLHDIHSTELKHDEVAIWWMGQSGYAIKTASTLFYVDLYLSDHLTKKYAETDKPHIRMMQAPLRGEDLRDVRWLFSSHKHSDHLDPGIIATLAKNNPQMKIILPRANVDYAKSLGLDDHILMPTVGNETLHLGEMAVHVLPSAHEALDYDEAYGYPYIGFVFEMDGVTLYHSGDTVIYEGLAERLERYQPDIVFLPINGTDERLKALKVPPNMGIDDALNLAGQIDNTLLIPHHYDMFTFNTVDVSQFIQAADARKQAYRVLQCGEKFIYKTPATD